MHVDPSHTDYTLSSLTSDTLYMVRMAAYTDEGGKDGPEFTFTTPKFGERGAGSLSPRHVCALERGRGASRARSHGALRHQDVGVPVWSQSFLYRERSPRLCRFADCL